MHLMVIHTGVRGKHFLLVFWSGSRQVGHVANWLSCPQELSWGVLILSVSSQWLFALSSFRLYWNSWHSLLVLSWERSVWGVSISSYSQDASLWLRFAWDWWKYRAGECDWFICQQVAWGVEYYWFCLNLVSVVVKVWSWHCCIICIWSWEQILESLMNLIFVDIHFSLWIFTRSCK